MAGHRRHILACIALVAFAASCSSKKTVKPDDDTPDQPAWVDPEFRPTPVATGSAARADDPDDPNKLVYLVSNNRQLYSFSPRTPGRAAYHLVGKLDCKAAGNPQSMAVDRHDTAWVFYDSRQLFKVSILDASCTPTPYVHPTTLPLLGMGFTSVAPGSSDERLYMVSPYFGLATISMPDLGVQQTGKLKATSELTGGGDARLFRFEAQRGELSEIDTRTYGTRLVHKFTSMWRVNAFAFARYAGRFYMFTSNDEFSPSTTTIYDPKTDTEEVRDTNVGFVVVGAGQSTLVPRGDASPDQITGSFPDDQR